MLKKDLKKLYNDIELEYYINFDRGHDKRHLKEVFNNTKMLCEKIGLDERNTYLALIGAIYHDTGIKYGRKDHHIHSYNIVLKDKRLKQFLSKKEISMVAYTCLNHRCSSRHDHRTLISRIVADADNLATVERHIERSIYFNLDHGYTDNLYENVYKHIKSKFGRNGYAKYILQETRGLKVIEDNYKIIENEEEFKKVYDKVYKNIK